jgi:hypothetical protein
MLSEAFFVPAMIFALIWSVNSLDSKDSKSSFYAGLAWGLTTLMRPHGLPLFIAFALYSGWRTGWRPMVLSLLGFSCLMAPWFVRNLVVFGRPVLLATEAGETLLGSNNPYVLKDPELHGLWLSPMKVPQYRERLLPIQDELERNRQQNAMALQYLREHPPNIPILAFYKLRRWLTPIPKSRGMIRVLVLVSYGGLLFFLFLGLFTGAYTRSTSLLIQVTCSIFFASITIVYWGALIRGRLPLEILWIPWASLAATQFIRKWTHAPQTARIRSFSPG